MPSKKRAGNKKKGSQSNFAKLSIFQPKNTNLRKLVLYLQRVLQKLIIKTSDC